ncbi:MAG TPA: hypothetical protein VK549_03330 [Acidimicrobiia bacterium]|nr:hypothetical protein [Acidimicrobiia bacterium]
MTRRFRTVAAVLVAMACLALVPAGPASAGGSSWTLDREHYQPGDTAFAWAAIAWAHNPDLGTPAEGPYHASLVEYSPDTASGQALERPLTPVGDLTISLEPYGTGPVRFGPHHAELRFTVPNLPPGRYLLVHANDAGKYVGDLSGQSLFWIDAPVVRAAPTFTG